MQLIVLLVAHCLMMLFVFLLDCNLCDFHLNVFAGLYDRYSMRLFCTAVQLKDKRFPLPVLPLVGNTWYCNKCIKLGGEWRNSVCGLYKSTLIENLAGIQNHLSFK